MCNSTVIGNEVDELQREVRRLTAILNRLRHNPARAAITVELLKFRDGIGHIDKCHLPAEDAHRMKNGLAHIYAEHIATMLVPEEDRDG